MLRELWVYNLHLLEECCTRDIEFFHSPSKTRRMAGDNILPLKYKKQISLGKQRTIHCWAQHRCDPCRRRTGKTLQVERNSVTLIGRHSWAILPSIIHQEYSHKRHFAPIRYSLHLDKDRLECLRRRRRSACKSVEQCLWFVGLQVCKRGGHPSCEAGSNTCIYQWAAPFSRVAVGILPAVYLAFQQPTVQVSAVHWASHQSLKFYDQIYK